MSWKNYVDSTELIKTLKIFSSQNCAQVFLKQISRGKKLFPNYSRLRKSTYGSVVEKSARQQRKILICMLKCDDRRPWKFKQISTRRRNLDFRAIFILYSAAVGLCVQLKIVCVEFVARVLFLMDNFFFGLG